MFAITSYNNTLCEIEMANQRLAMLMDRKKELYCSCNNISKKNKKDVGSGEQYKSENMSKYIYEINKKNKITGKSLEEEIQEQMEIINKMDNYLSRMTDTLKKVKGTEADLYKEIVVNGKKVTEAVEAIAELYDKDNSTIWRLYHKTIKKEIKMLVNCKQKMS